MNRGKEQQATEFLRASQSARDDVHADVVVVRRIVDDAKKRFFAGKTEKQLVLSPTAVVGSQEYEDAQQKLRDAGVDITETSSSSLASTINVSTALTEDELASIVPGVFTVVNKPKIKPRAVTATLHGVNAYFPDLKKSCGVNSNVLRQATMVDQLRGRMGPANRGAGVMVIVWDFLPEENAEVPKDLSVNRKGGPLYIYRNQSTAVDPHGIFVASLVGGLTSGLVTDSTLVLVGVNDVLSDLALIKKLVEDFPGPVVVNFSAAMEFKIEGKESSLQRAQLQCALYDAAVNEIKEKKNCVIFVCAAGNENLDLCAATGAVSLRPDCTDCICWPQSRFGSDTPGPFIQVGATEVNPSGARKKAVYSNFGRCIDVFSHGGNICGFNTPTASYVALQGTSFASPTVSAILAAIASQDTLKITAANAIKTLQSAQQDLVSGVATTTTRAFAFVPDTVIFDSGDGKVPDYTFPREDTIVWTLNDDTDKESDDQTFKIVAVVLLVLCIFILLPFLVNKK